MATKLEDRIARLETTLSRRIVDLEEQVLRLSQQVNSKQPSDESPWWKRIVGVYKDDPEFEEAMRLGREYRESLRPKDDKDSA